jgi:hypothetical protein
MLKRNSEFAGRFSVVPKSILPHSGLCFKAGAFQGICDWMVELSTQVVALTKLFCNFEEEMTLGTPCRTPASMQTVVLVRSGHQCLLQNLYWCG